MSEFLPLNDDHAIQSVRFAVHFSGALSPEIMGQFLQGKFAWSEALPASAVGDTIVDLGMRKAKVPVAIFSFLRPDGAPTWSLNVGGTSAVVDCFLYTRWNRVWETALGFLQEALTKLAALAEGAKIIGIELQVVDVFHTNDDVSDVSPLFSDTQGYLSPFVLFGSPPWHCNIGWFLRADGERVLNRLETTVSSSNQEGAPRWSVQIDHSQNFHVPNGIELTNNMEVALSDLVAKMQFMHRNNKETLHRMLSKKALERISLKAGGDNEQS